MTRAEPPLGMYRQLDAAMRFARHSVSRDVAGLARQEFLPAV